MLNGFFKIELDWTSWALPLLFAHGQFVYLLTKVQIGPVTFWFDWSALSRPTEGGE